MDRPAKAQPSVPKFSATPINGHQRQPQYRLGRHRKITVFLLCLLIVVSGTCGVLLVKYHGTASSNPSTQQQRLTRQLSQLIVMPPEQPIISTVLNNTKLTNQTLAQEARDGDKLFIFPGAKRLILYRPSDQKVVDMLTIQT